MSKEIKEDIKIDETAENTAVSEDATEESSVEETATEEVATEEAEDIPKRLVATSPILYLSHQYEVGETLPANNPDMVEAWLEAKTATWVAQEQTKVPVKARPATAEPGQQGAAVASESEDGDNLVGKVPKTAKRSKK